jgi:hypothetical protein
MRTKNLVICALQQYTASAMMLCWLLPWSLALHLPSGRDIPYADGCPHHRVGGEPL